MKKRIHNELIMRRLSIVSIMILMLVIGYFSFFRNNHQYYVIERTKEEDAPCSNETLSVTVDERYLVNHGGKIYHSSKGEAEFRINSVLDADDYRVEVVPDRMEVYSEREFSLSPSEDKYFKVKYQMKEMGSGCVDVNVFAYKGASCIM